MLAVGLKERGHQVRFLVYHPDDHFLSILEEADIPCQMVRPCSHIHRLLAVRQIFHNGWQDVVLAFLEGPCLYAELSKILGGGWGLVAGERLADPRIKNGTGRWLRHFHRFADAVVCNSHSNRLMLEAGFPFLRNKVATIYNTIDLQLFHPALPVPADSGNSSFQPCRIVVAASYQEKKNMMGVAKALLQIKKSSFNQRVVIDWFGAIPADNRAFLQVERFIAENGLVSSFRLHPSTKGIEKEYESASAVGLFSFFEGIPNVVCEGMACGKPILMSNVCDAGSLVRDGKNGFLCDPRSPESMANALRRLAALSDHERKQMGLESRGMSEELFSRSVVIDRYESILKAAARHQPMPLDCTWPREVPESAMRTLKQWANDYCGE
jgi:glycosyltransferase involved in cell wall biosynthesis